MRIERLLYLLLILERKQKITAKELANELETSVKTIYRDIEKLCESGIPVCTEPGPGVEYHLWKGIKHKLSI